MTTETLVADPNTEQTLLGFFESIGVTSPLSPTAVETEQKYIHGRDECEWVYRSQAEHIRACLKGQSPRVAYFDGVDHCFNVTSHTNKKMLLRYRTGKPADRRMGLKAKIKGAPLSRREREFHLSEGTPEHVALDFLRDIARDLGKSYTEAHLEVRGTIFYVSYPEIPGSMIEVVVSTTKNLGTRKMVAVSEIEAHGFPEYSQAKAAIIFYEQQLTWTHLRTKKNMSELLS